MKQPSGTIFIADSGYEFSDSNAGFCAKAFKHKEEGGYKRGVMLRHSGKANVLLGDWHAESLNEGELRNSLNRITYVLDMKWSGAALRIWGESCCDCVWQRSWGWPALYLLFFPGLRADETPELGDGQFEMESDTLLPDCRRRRKAFMRMTIAPCGRLRVISAMRCSLRVSGPSRDMRCITIPGSERRFIRRSHGGGKSGRAARTGE